jgi:aldehyde dehydrogenase (NAD+)
MASNKGRSAVGESRMLIDGRLVDAESGATFNNVNPATEEVLGPVADGSPADMARAVDAARRAFETTGWASDTEARKACLDQLQAAIESEQEDLRQELIAEVGTPALITYGPQLDAPLREALRWPRDMIDEFEWTRSLGPKDAMGVGYQTEREVWKEPVGVVGVTVEFPDRDHPQQTGPPAGHGKHLRPQTRPRHPVERHTARSTDRRADRHSARGGQHRHLS